MDPTAEQSGPIARKHGIRLLLRFGSSVTGHLHERSDIDLAVQLETFPESLQAHSELMADLQQLYPGDRIDLALINRADPLLLKKITEACVLVHGDPRDLRQLELRAFKRYQDHKKYLVMERAYVRRQLGRRTPA